MKWRMPKIEGKEKVDQRRGNQKESSGGRNDSSKQQRDVMAAGGGLQKGEAGQNGLRMEGETICSL